MKTICIYHSRDLDGWMSAAIVKKWFLDNHLDAVVRDIGEVKGSIPHLNELGMIGWDYGDPIPELPWCDKIIICDVSFPAEEMFNLYNRITNNGEFIWIDHHISAIKSVDDIMEANNVGIKGLRDINFAACELTWKYFFPGDPMPEIVRLLGRYDCFGHKGTDEELKVLEFQYGARNFWSNYNKCYSALISWNDNQEHTVLMAGHHIYNYLCTEAEQTYSKAFPITFNEPVVYGPGGLHDIGTWLCVNQERFNPINFGIDYHKNGYDGFACFWYKDGKWTFSLYNDNGKIDCSAIAKCFGGGGHKGAAGFVVDDLKKVIG